MGLARYFVVRRQDEWLVMLEGRAMAVHRSQPQAISSAIVMADLHHDADVMVEDNPGAPLRLVWTYGQDKVPASPIPVLQVVPSHSHVKRVQRPPELKAS